MTHVHEDSKEHSQNEHPLGEQRAKLESGGEGWVEVETPSLSAKPSTCFNKRAISISKLSGPSYSQLPFIQAQAPAKH